MKLFNQYFGYQNLIVLGLVLFFSSLMTGCGPLTRSDLDKACLEGHLYWTNGAPGQSDFAFAPIQDDDGKPVKCR